MLSTCLKCYFIYSNYQYPPALVKLYLTALYTGQAIFFQNMEYIVL